MQEPCPSARTADNQLLLGVQKDSVATAAFPGVRKVCTMPGTVFAVWKATGDGRSGMLFGNRRWDWPRDGWSAACAVIGAGSTPWTSGRLEGSFCMSSKCRSRPMLERSYVIRIQS